jgi:hypothetical protein
MKSLYAALTFVIGRLKTVVDLVCPTCRRLVCPTCRRDGTDVRSPRHLTALTHDGDCGVLPALAKVDLKHHLNLRGKHRSTSDVALCSGLAPLINNHFGRRALLRGRLRLRAINATALIEATVTTAALSEPGAWPVFMVVRRAFEYAGADELAATKIYEFCKGRHASEHVRRGRDSVAEGEGNLRSSRSILDQGSFASIASLL